MIKEAGFFKIRITNIEIRHKLEMLKTQKGRKPFASALSVSRIGILKLFRTSDFEFRISP
jgi:hypothetical protein